MAKLFKKIFMLFMVITFIFSAFGCDNEEQSDSLPVINKEASLSDLANFTNIVRFEYYSQIKDFICLNGGKTDKYFASINFDDFNTPYGITYDCGGINDKTMVLRTGGDHNTGIYDTALVFSMYAYPVSEKPTDLTFEHFVTDSAPVSDWDGTAKEKAVFISSGQEVVVKFFYTPFKEHYTEEYIENFLKERLQWIGTVSWEQEEIRTEDQWTIGRDFGYWGDNEIKYENLEDLKNNIPSEKYFLYTNATAYNYLVRDEKSYLRSSIIEIPALWGKTQNCQLYSIETKTDDKNLVYEYVSRQNSDVNGEPLEGHLGVYIYIYQENTLIAILAYNTESHTPDYFTVVEYLKENLVFIGGNNL